MMEGGGGWRGGNISTKTRKKQIPARVMLVSADFEVLPSFSMLMSSPGTVDSVCTQCGVWTGSHLSNVR